MSKGYRFFEEGHQRSDELLCDVGFGRAFNNKITSLLKVFSIEGGARIKWNDRTQTS